MFVINVTTQTHTTKIIDRPKKKEIHLTYIKKNKNTQVLNRIFQKED